MAIWSSASASAQNNDALFELNYLSATPVANSTKTMLTYTAYGRQLVLLGTFTQANDGSYQGTVTSITAKDSAGTDVYSLTNFQTDLKGLISATPEQRLRLFSGNDTIKGSAQGDWLFGHDGNDVIYGGAGNDFMDGGNGTDYMRLDGVSSDYLLQSFHGTLQAKNLQSGEVDVAVNTERILFGNNAVLAMDSTGSAGDVFRLYYAAYHQAMTSLDQMKALGSAVLSVDRGGSLATVADGILKTSDISSLSDASYVALLFANVFNRDPSADESLYWTNKLSDGERTRNDLLVGASQLDSFISDTASLTATGIWFFA